MQFWGTRKHRIPKYFSLSQKIWGMLKELEKYLPCLFNGNHLLSLSPPPSSQFWGKRTNFYKKPVNHQKVFFFIQNTIKTKHEVSSGCFLSRRREEKEGESCNTFSFPLLLQKISFLMQFSHKITQKIEPFLQDTNP